ncbi:MAG: glycogen debranching enzyme GlgX, partial [Mesorhizobium sp.]|nr:glycogen debranching enzyme GlgX [Mesorhizobium sp.]
MQEGGVRFAAWSGAAERIWVSLFDQQGKSETDRLELTPEGEGVFARFVGGLGEGARYGLRANGPFAPEKGLWFDPDKLLVDPYAVQIDRPYVYDMRLTAGERGVDTAALVPKAVVRERLPEAVPAPPLFQPGGLIYEVSVRAFTMRHPDIPVQDRGT